MNFKYDLSLIPDTFDAVHIGLAATVLGLLFVQILFLIVAIAAVCRRCEPRAARRAPEDAKPADSSPKPETPKPAKAEKAAPLPERERVRTETVVVREATPDAALQLLGLLQKEARFVDFVQENVAAYSDADVGAAARVVHEGCRKVLRQCFELAPVREESEGKRLTLPKGFDASSVRLTGNIVGQPPFTGTLIHRGWKATEVKLPKLTEGHDAAIIAAAEVEL